jgi:hypothetical protein
MLIIGAAKPVYIYRDIYMVSSAWLSFSNGVSYIITL